MHDTEAVAAQELVLARCLIGSPLSGLCFSRRKQLSCTCITCESGKKTYSCHTLNTHTHTHTQLNRSSGTQHCSGHVCFMCLQQRSANSLQIANRFDHAHNLFTSGPTAHAQKQIWRVNLSGRIGRQLTPCICTIASSAAAQLCC